MFGRLMIRFGSLSGTQNEPKTTQERTENLMHDSLDRQTPPRSLQDRSRPHQDAPGTPQETFEIHMHMHAHRKIATQIDPRSPEDWS